MTVFKAIRLSPLCANVRVRNAIVESPIEWAGVGDLRPPALAENGHPNATDWRLGS